MRKLMNKIDRFCYTHPRFGIPNLMLIIVIGNAAVWLLAQMDTTGQIVSLLSGSAQGILHGQVWRLITYVFVPTESRPIWLLLMLYFYYWIGSCLEREWGNGKFTIYYVSGMLLTAIYGGINGTFAPIADYTLLSQAVAAAAANGVALHVGNVLSSDNFYDDGSDGPDQWKKMGVLAVEMEAAGLYMNAARAGKRALGLFTISDHIYRAEELTSEQRQNSFVQMITIALDTAVNMANL